jgi:sec-independent protein translocase protein TatA
MGLGGLGMWEMLLIFLVVLLLFGAKRLPEIGSSLGKGIREFKGSIREMEREIKAVEDETKLGSEPYSKSYGDEDQEPRTLNVSSEADDSDNIESDNSNDTEDQGTIEDITEDIT